MDDEGWVHNDGTKGGKPCLCQSYQAVTSAPEMRSCAHFTDEENLGPVTWR